ncbi:hypothetical protein CPB85DRAFT_1248495 [Mucidula mucida]|nr:hypothetical protein CPB85DRAFT_1248495 [Mucidula mucida]
MLSTSSTEGLSKDAAGTERTRSKLRLLVSRLPRAYARVVGGATQQDWVKGGVIAGLVIVLSGPVELGDVGQIKAGDDIPADAFGLVPSSAKADQVGLSLLQLEAYQNRADPQMSLGTRRMAKQNVIVRNLDALGNVGHRYLQGQTRYSHSIWACAYYLAL